MVHEIKTKPKGRAPGAYGSVHGSCVLLCVGASCALHVRLFNAHAIPRARFAISVPPPEGPAPSTHCPHVAENRAPYLYTHSAI